MKQEGVDIRRTKTHSRNQQSFLRRQSLKFKRSIGKKNWRFPCNVLHNHNPNAENE